MKWTQYKKLLDLSNLCNHGKDFWARYEWHFFATSHGESAFDVISGAAKKTIPKTNLQRPSGNQISMINEYFTFCTQVLG